MLKRHQVIIQDFQQVKLSVQTTFLQKIRSKPFVSVNVCILARDKNWPLCVHPFVVIIRISWVLKWPIVSYKSSSAATADINIVKHATLTDLSPAPMQRKHRTIILIKIKQLLTVTRFHKVSVVAHLSGSEPELFGLNVFAQQELPYEIAKDQLALLQLASETATQKLVIACRYYESVDQAILLGDNNKPIRLNGTDSVLVVIDVLENTCSVSSFLKPPTNKLVSRLRLTGLGFSERIGLSIGGTERHRRAVQRVGSITSARR